MNSTQTILEPAVEIEQGIMAEEINETQYASLSNEEALVITAEVIEKYRPALEKLAE